MLLRRTILALLAACGVAGFSHAQKSPEDTVKSMTVADGLQVELFAAEPMVINPTSIDVDHLGRVWVCEAVNYRRTNFKRPILRPEGDRIVILTDKDGDGKADESTVFYQGTDLYGPIGICVAPLASGVASAPRGACKVFVCQSPDILLFTDADGDGKADGPPKKFLTGFGGFDHDHGVHGINIGPDGKLYFTVGDQGLKGLQASDGKGRKFVSNSTDCRAGTVWRCDMDGTNLELIAHNFRNNYECCVNSFGEIWLSDNDDDGNQQTRICHVMPGGDYGYFPRGPGQSHWHEEQPGIVHKTMRTGFGSPTGICFYEGTLLPKKYQGQLLHTDAGPRELRAFHIKPKGAGYELEKENIVTSTDNWFRLSDVCVAPDGSLMLADWYDPGVGGHGMGDWTRGRIYRVTPTGHKGYKVPVVKLDTKEGLLTSLGSPCLATRAVAQDAIRRMDRAAREEVDVRDPAFTDNELLESRFWLLIPSITQSPEQAGKLAVELSNRRGPIRAAGVRFFDVYYPLLGGVFAVDKPDLTTFDKFISTFDLAQKRDFLLVLRKVTNTKVVTPAVLLMAESYDGKDIFYRAALNIACGTDPARRDAILADFDKHFPEWNDKVADLVWELRPKSVLPRLGKLLDDPKLTPGQKARVVDIVAVQDDPAAGLTMLKLLGGDAPAAVKARAVDNLRVFLPNKWNALPKSDDWKTTIAALLKDDAGLMTGLDLVSAAKDRSATPAVAELADSQSRPYEVRTAAVRTLGRLPEPKAVETIRGLLEERRDVTAALALEAIQALGAIAGTTEPAARKALDVLEPLVHGTNTPEDRGRAAVAALAGGRAGSQWLIAIKERGGMPDRLASEAGRLLRNSPYQDLRNKALIAFPAAAKLDPKKLPPISELVKRQGDVKRGEAVFKASAMSDSQCMKCHMVRGAGGNIGPDLSMIGKKGSKENLYDSLLTPSKAVADQYVQWKVETLDGKPVSGLLVAESATSLTLRDANGKDHTFATKDLDGPKQKGLVSLMPDSLVTFLTEDDLVDLVEYMMTLKTAALTPDAWAAMGPFTRTGNSGFDFDYGPEKTPFDPKATFPEWTGPSSGPKAKDLAWRTVATDAKGYIDLAVLHGDAAKDSISYLYRDVESPVAQSAEFLIGSDDGCKLIVNGETVLTVKETRAAAPGQNRVTVKLKAGKNTVLLKVANGDNPHGAYVTILSEQELKAGK